MLKEKFIEFEDGTIVKELVHLKAGEQIEFFPKRDNIKHAGVKTFKYEVEKHAYLPLAIVNFPSRTVIMPAGIECHPETTLDDIVVIEPKKEDEEPKPREKRTWKFESASSDGFYTVRQNMGKLSCNCMGVWRAKDRRCKHIKEVEKELGIVK